MVGVIEFGNFRRGTMADIPGLIEGAHQNIGLGHDFLRHIQRCRILVFVVDTAGSEGRDPVADIETLRTEIKLYDSAMAKRPWVIICNKMDLPEAEEHFEHIKERFKRVRIFPISADQGTGLDKLKRYLDDKIGEQVKW